MPLAGLAVALCLGAVACGPRPGGTAVAPPSTTPAAAKRDAPGPTLVTLAIYTDLEGQEAAERAETGGLLRRLRESCQDDACRRDVALLEERDALAVTMASTRELPTPEFAFTRGSAGSADLERLQAFRQVILLGAQDRRSRTLHALAAAYRAADHLARDVDGVVFDPETLAAYQPGDVPRIDPGARRITDLVSLGILPLDEAYRIVTFGLERFEAPDLVAAGVPRESLGVASAMVRALAAQRVAGRGRGLETTVTAADVRAAAGDDISLPAVPVAGSAMTSITVNLAPAERRGSDPENALHAVEPEPGKTLADTYGAWQRLLAGSMKP